MTTLPDNHTQVLNQELSQRSIQEEDNTIYEQFQQNDTQLLPSHIIQILKQENRPAIEAEKLHEHFKHLSFFEKLRSEGGSQINDLLLHEVWRNVEFAQIPSNQLIFKEKDPSNNKMFIILSGKVGISVKPLQEEISSQNNDNIKELNQNQSKKGVKGKEIQQNLKDGGQAQQNTIRTESENLKGNSSQNGIQNNQIQLDDASNPNRGNQTKVNQTPLEEIISSESSESDSDDESFEQQEYLPFPELGKKVAELGSGKAFGEQALFKEGGYRNASVYTLEPTRFLVIYRDKFLGILGVIEQIKQDKVQRIGNVIPFFNDIVSKILKDRMIYLFEDVTQVKGTVLTQENSKGQYIYVLKSGRVALEKSIVLEEYKEKESLDTKTVTFQHRFSEFASAELIGDEILAEKNKIYLHKRNLRPSEYLYTCIVLSSEATFLRLNKKKVIEGFPKYIVEKLRENIQQKKETRKMLIEDYVEKVQPNFLQHQRKQIFMKKNLATKLKVSNNATLLLGESTPLSQNSSPSKKVQFQNIVRNSILPPSQLKKDYSLEANKSLIKELSIIKLKKQRSIQNKKDGDNNSQSDGARGSLNSLSQVQQNGDDFKVYSRNSTQLSQQNSVNSYQQDAKENQNNDIESNPLIQSNTSILQGVGQQKSHFSKNKPSIGQSISLNETEQHENPNYFTSNGFSIASHQNYQTFANNLNISSELQQEFASTNIHQNSKNTKFRLSQSNPSLTVFNKNTPTEPQQIPPFYYHHSQQISKNTKQKDQNQKQEEYFKVPNQQNQPSSNIPDQQYTLQEKLKKEAREQEKNYKLQKYKNKHYSQVSKKIECNIMKKEIIYQHMMSIKEYKQLDPFEDTNSKRQRQVKKELEKMYQKSMQQFSQTQLSISPQRELNKQQRQTNEGSDTITQNKSLQPIKETKNEELTSKQFILLNNTNNNISNSATFSETSNGNSSENITQSTKPNKLDFKKNVVFKLKKDDQTNIYPLTDRSKSSQVIGSNSILIDEDNIQESNEDSDSEDDYDKIHKQLSLLSGNNKKKFYMLLDTWDLGVENLKMKELDLRNGLYRKGMIHKPPHEQIHKDYFEKLDEHQLKVFQKYLKKKKRQSQKEVNQMQNLVTMIKPDVKTQTSPDRSQAKERTSNFNLKSLQEIENDNTEQLIAAYTKPTTNKVLSHTNLIDFKQKRRVSNESKQLYQSASLSNLVTVNGNIITPNNFDVVPIKQLNQNNMLKQHHQRQQQLNPPPINLALPQISPSKKVIQQHFVVNLNGNNSSITHSLRAKTEGDYDQEEYKQRDVNNISSGLIKLNKQVQSLGEKQVSLRQFQESSQQLSMVQYLISPIKQQKGITIQKQYNPSLTERNPKDALVAQKLNSNSAQQLPNIVYNTNSYKNSQPNQELNKLKFTPSKSQVQIEPINRHSFLNKFTSVSGSNLASPNGNQNERMKQKVFLSPTTTKLLQKQQ